MHARPQQQNLLPHGSLVVLRSHPSYRGVEQQRPVATGGRRICRS
jgi:hypothetical protein